MIVQVKQHPPPPPAQEQQQLLQQLAPVGNGGRGNGDAETSFPHGVGNVVFGSQPNLAAPQREFRLPMLVVEEEVEEAEKTSVVVMPIRVPYRVVDGVVQIVEDEEVATAVRVKRIKVEGQASQEASRALKPFWEKKMVVEDIAGLEYAMDVIAKQVE